MRKSFGTTVLLAALLAVALPDPLAAQSWRNATFARQTQGETALDVQVEYAAGKLSIAPADGALLYEMKTRYDEEQFTPHSSYDRDSGTLRLGLGTRKGNDGNNIKMDDEATAAIRLARNVPMEIDLDFGAGEADLELGGLAVRELDLSTGASSTRVRFSTPNAVAAKRVRMQAGAAELRAENLANSRAERFSFQGGVGETVLDFGGEWTRNASAEVKLGIGSLTLRFPRDLGVKLEKSSFLTSFNANGLVKRGNAYYSRNWDRAAHRLTVDVSAALGSIDVEWIN